MWDNFTTWNIYVDICNEKHTRTRRWWEEKREGSLKNLPAWLNKEEKFKFLNNDVNKTHFKEVKVVTDF